MNGESVGQPSPSPSPTPSDCCIGCGEPLDRYGVGATKRFLNRGADRFYCTVCLAARLKVSHEMLMEKIETLKKQGCSLFV